MRFHSIICKYLPLVLLMFCAFTAQTQASTFQAQVVEVINGCTLKVLTDDGIISVRIAEILNPSSSLLDERQAKSFLQEMTLGRDLTLVFWAMDAMGRNVCEVLLPDGSNLATLLVANGLALQDRYYSSSAEIRQVEEQARKGRQGLWQHMNQFTYASLK